MPHYYAVNEHFCGVMTLAQPRRNLFKPYGGPRLVSTQKDAIVANFNTIKNAIILFDDEEMAIKKALSHSNYIDSFGNFASQPIFLVEYSKQVSNHTSVNPKELKLLKAKLLHVGNKTIRTLPYHDLAGIVATSTNPNESALEIERKITNKYIRPTDKDDFDTRIALTIFVLVTAISNDLNQRTINTESLSLAIIAGTLAAFLYFKNRLEKTYSNTNIEIEEEIKSLSRPSL